MPQVPMCTVTVTVAAPRRRAICAAVLSRMRSRSSTISLAIGFFPFQNRAAGIERGERFADGVGQARDDRRVVQRGFQPLRLQPAGIECKTVILYPVSVAKVNMGMAQDRRSEGGGDVAQGGTVDVAEPEDGRDPGAPSGRCVD